MDHVLIMSVNPGFGGQAFIPNALKKIQALAWRRKELGLNFAIEIDGGVSPENAAEITRAGCDWLVAGSSIFHTPDPGQAVHRFAARGPRRRAREGLIYKVGYGNMAQYFLIAIVMASLLTSCGFKRKKYDDPITKDTKQPDKVLFDRAIDDIEHGRYEIARITLNTLINTYDQSEFLAKAKLAIADSWFREGGAASLAQAEAEYKDFILFYPTMEEAAESQQKICLIHYKQMDKADRDQTRPFAPRTNAASLIIQFPNSKYVDETKQLLRNIQEAIAEGEFLVGNFYFKRGDNSAAANRLSHVVDQYPLYSKADLALWQMGQSYGRLGNRFRKQEGDAYAKIVRDYPLSDYADDATREAQGTRDCRSRKPKKPPLPACSMRRTIA